MKPSTSPPLQLGAYDKPSCQVLHLHSHLMILRKLPHTWHSQTFITGVNFHSQKKRWTYGTWHQSACKAPQDWIGILGTASHSYSHQSTSTSIQRCFLQPTWAWVLPHTNGDTRGLFDTKQEHESTHHSRAASLSHSPRQSTPLHKAVEQGNEGIVRILVLHQANIHALNAEGRTALHIAVERDHRAIVCCLLDAGSKLDIPDFQGRLPLEIAIASENEELVQLLLSRGADANIAVMTHQRND